MNTARWIFFTFEQVSLDKHLILLHIATCNNQVSFCRNKPQKLFEPKRFTDFIYRRGDLGFLEVTPDFAFCRFQSLEKTRLTFLYTF